MDTPRPQDLRGADEVAPWVVGSQIAWDLMARRHRPFTALSQDDDDGDDRRTVFERLRELLNRMPTEVQPPREAAAVNDTGAAYVDDGAYRNGGFGAVPASSEVIAGLSVITAGIDAREQSCCTCAVCLQDFEGGDKLRRLPCFHSFHEPCIFDWLRVSGACPLCRHRAPAAHGTIVVEMWKVGSAMSYDEEVFCAGTPEFGETDG